MKKYNLALLPKSKNKEILKLVSSFTSQIESYKLGNNSLPHITIAQFYQEDIRIDEIWNNILENLGVVEINLNLQHISYITFGEEIFWVSLLPDNQDNLCQMNEKVLPIVKPASKRKFDPHMTLFNTKDRLCETKHKEIAIPQISDNFYLAIGECDQVGQFTKIIKSALG